MDLTGPQRFARFAYPPNALGYCGPDNSDDLFHLATVEPDEELLRLAKAFEGAFPYLELLAGANHSFHVLSVSPWIGLLRGGLIDQPLGIIDECRISWGTVLSVEGQHLVVERAPLVWSGEGLEYGPPVPAAIQGLVPCAIGDVVAIHWGWACERLDSRQVAWLRHVTNSQLSARRRP